MAYPRVQKRNYYIAQAFKTTPYGVSLVEHMLQIQDSLSISPWAAAASGGIDWRISSVKGGYQAGVSEVDGVVTVTEPGTLSPSTTYAFTLTQNNPVTKEIETQIISYTTPATGTPAQGSVVTALNNILKLYKTFNLASSTVSTATLTITAASGYPIITISALVGGLTSSVSTAGVNGFGNLWDMNNIGDTGAIAGDLYDVCDFYYTLHTPEGDLQDYWTRLYINQSGANYSGFAAALKALLTPASTATVYEGLTL